MRNKNPLKILHARMIRLLFLLAIPGRSQSLGTRVRHQDKTIYFTIFNLIKQVLFVIVLQNRTLLTFHFLHYYLGVQVGNNGKLFHLKCYVSQIAPEISFRFFSSKKIQKKNPRIGTSLIIIYSSNSTSSGHKGNSSLQSQRICVDNSVYFLQVKQGLV